MFKKILLPLDLSEASEALFKSLQSFKAVGLEELILLHVVDVRTAGALAGQLQEHNTVELEKRAAAIEEAGLKIHVKAPIGIPYIEILEMAENEDVDLIIIGSKGKTFLQRAFLGSVAEFVIHHSDRPVLVEKFALIKERETTSYDLACPNPFNKVIYPTDFSNPAEKVIPILKALAGNVCELALVHIQEERLLKPHLEHKLEEFNEIDRGRLERIRHDLQDTGYDNVSIRLATGAAVKLILEIAEEEQATMIALGAKGKSDIAEVLLGGTAVSITRHSEIPVLLVP